MHGARESLSVIGGLAWALLAWLASNNRGFAVAVFVACAAGIWLVMAIVQGGAGTEENTP